MRKWLVGGIILVVVGLLLYVSVQPPKKLKITTIRESHTIINQANQGGVFEVSLFINLKRTPLTKQENIRGVSLKNEDNIIPLELKNIILHAQVKILEEEYQEWIYQFEVLFPQEFIMSPASLVFDTVFMVEMMIDIGSVSYYHESMEAPNLLHLTQLKGLVVNDGESYLSGIIMRMAPLTTPMTIVGVEALNGELKVGSPVEIASGDYSSTTPIDTFLSTPYERMALATEASPIIIHQEVTLLFPLYYRKPYHVSEVAFRIYACVDNQISTYFVPPFCYFLDSIQRVQVSELIFYEFSID